MNYLHIELLTPLHIGSGRILRMNTEFLKFDDAISVIDDHKILEIIGEENIQKWVDIIGNGEDLLAYLKQRRQSKAIHPQETDKRILPIVGRYSKPENGLREQVFSGNGKPLLPGSSLKGSIRTAIVNSLIENQPGVSTAVLKSKVIGENRRGQRTVKYGKFENKLIGKDPNHDSFRLLRIGDVHFEQTVCLLTQTLNKTSNGIEIKGAVNQLVESIPTGSEAVCRVSIPDDLLKEINKRPAVATEMKASKEVTNWTELFNRINRFTKKQVALERAKYDSVELPREAAILSEKLEAIEGEINTVKSNQCIIRVGYGTGYLNMTGGWSLEQWKKVLSPDAYKKELEDLGTAVRKNSRYNSFELPKSRKIVSGGEPMGFLKLSLWEEDDVKAWHDEAEARGIELKRQKALVMKERQVEAEKVAKAARLAELEAKKPKFFEGKLKPGVELDAEIVVSGKPNKVKIFVEGQLTDHIPLIGYAASEAVGRVVVVTVNVLKKDGKVLDVRYKKFK